MNQLRIAIEEKYPTDSKQSKGASEVLAFVRAYMAEEQAKYQTNKDNNAITFGKYKGQTPAQVAGLDKGLDYLGWISRQTWFSEDKFESLYPLVMDQLKKTPIV